MSSTLIEKLLLHNSGEKQITPGDLIRIQPTLIASSHYSINKTIRTFKRSGMKKLVNKENIVIINNASPVDSSHQSMDTYLLQKFIREYEIEHYFELGRSGVPGVLLEEQGFVVPGTLLISAEKTFSELGVLGSYVVENSSNEIALSWATGEQWIKVPHTVELTLEGSLGNWTTGTDAALHVLRVLKPFEEEHYVFEIKGEGLENLPIHERFNLVQVLSDLSGHGVICESDAKVLEYLAESSTREAEYFYADEDAQYLDKMRLNLNTVEPMVCISSDGEEISYIRVSELENSEDSGIDKIFMGACGSGRFEDVQIGVSTGKFRKVHDHVQTIFMPATARTWSDLINEGLMGILTDLGHEIYPASFFRTLAESVGIYTSNVHVLTSSSQLFLHALETNGHNIYLSSIMTAFASSVQGKICHPASIQHEEERHRDSN